MLLGFTWKDLYCRDGLVRLDSVFLTHLKATDEALHGRLLSARAAPESLTDKQSSDLIVELAPHLEDFLGDLFEITPELTALQVRHNRAVGRLFHRFDRLI